MKDIEAVVSGVAPGSIADELGIEQGDRVISVNKKRPKDLIDYRYLCAEEDLELDILKNDGEVWTCDIQKDYDDDLGLSFTEDTFDGLRTCANSCIFCFVDQMPVDMRESLYVKDDDYRMSFLHGNFVTLTNLTKKDLQRIVSLRISPIYISVHCTNPKLREKILGNRRAGKIMEQMKILAGAGIEMHTQVVLCPGINDGPELEKTVNDLKSLWPQVKSVALVPVGLTMHREGLHNLKKYETFEAGNIIDYVHKQQDGFLEDFGSPFIYLGDEFYVTAEREFPEQKHYGDFPQLENGVGIVRLFYDSFNEEIKRLPVTLSKDKKVAFVTGVSGEYVLRPLVEKLNKVEKLHVDLISVFNDFFGGHVTVAGLLTGRDIIKAFKNRDTYDMVLLPSVTCKRDEPIFLDGKTVIELEREIKSKVKVIDINLGARDLIVALLD